MDLDVALNAVDYNDEPPVSIQTESVDVYLLRPEEPREIEIKDFTIMKPNNNKMHRLIRFYPRRQVSYRAMLPAEEKMVVSLTGTATTTMPPRHNGGFSNPSRNAEIFRLKSDLLQEYFASVQDDDREAALFDALIGRSARPPQQSSWVSNAGYSDELEEENWSLVPLRKRRPLPKYKPVKVGDEDFIPLTGDKPGSLTLDERMKYVSSLWPGLAPVDDDEGIMDYYGIEVQIIAEEERENELSAETESSDMQTEGELSLAAATSVKKMVLIGADSKTKVEGNDCSSETTAPSSPQLSMKTRSAALQQLKEATAEDDDEIKPNPIATKQDDWVQCDKCQKWRRLPNQVDVSELPVVWYCKMNRWDKRHNKCSAQEEKLVVLMKGPNLAEYRQRKFIQDFIERCKRLDKIMHHYKYTRSHEDGGERKYVQCMECLKLRPLIGGMDPNKVAEPFVCWMNWDELLASCSAPEGPLYPRTKPERYYSSARGGSSISYISSDVAGGDVKEKNGVSTASDLKEKNGVSAASDLKEKDGVNTASDLATFGGGRGGNKLGRKGKRKIIFGTTEKGASVGKAGTKKTKRRPSA